MFESHMLRHFIAAVAYRGSNIVDHMPDHIADFRPAGNVRSPIEILNHINGVLTYAHSFFVSYESTKLPATDWSSEVERFYDILGKLDESLATGALCDKVKAEQLLQGPLADAMLHLGQIGIFRRIAGYPVEPENYLVANIQIGQIGRSEKS